MQNTIVEVRTNSKVTFSYGHLRTDVLMLNDHLEPIYNSSARIQGIVNKPCQEQWTIETNGMRDSRKIFLAARDDDDYLYIYICHVELLAQISLTLSRHPSLSSITLSRSADYILYQHRAVAYRFLLVVQPLLVHVKGSTRVHHLWVRPYFYSSVPHVCYRLT